MDRKLLHNHSYVNLSITPKTLHIAAMAKKGKLLAALDAHKGRDYRLEKQKKQQKQAAKKKRTKAPGSKFEEREKVESLANGTVSMPEAESDGWESDESEAAEATVVCRASTTSIIYWMLTRP